MSRCINCNKNNATIKIQVFTWDGFGKANVNFTCCSEMCKKEVIEFTNYVNKNAFKFLFLIILGCVSFIPFIILYGIFKNELFSILGIIIPLMTIGLSIIKYPFATPETNSWLGLRKAKKLTRIIGIILVVISIVSVLVCLLI